MADLKYTDITVEVKGQIGIVKFNRPWALNSLGGNLTADTIAAIRELDNHPDTVFTVLTGEGRFFCAGADVREGSLNTVPEFRSAGDKKIFYLHRFTPALELLRQIIDHKKVFILALNGPAVGAGAAWFPGVADIVLAADDAWLQIPFSALGLVPENGSAHNFAQSLGVHRANEILMFGRKVTPQELERWGLYNQIFPKEGFHQHYLEYLQKQVELNDGKSMMETKRLMNAPRRDARMLAVHAAMDALAERFVEGAPVKRFEAKRAEMEAKSKAAKSKI